MFRSHLSTQGSGGNLTYLRPLSRESGSVGRSGKKEKKRKRDKERKERKGYMIRSTYTGTWIVASPARKFYTEILSLQRVFEAVLRE